MKSAMNCELLRTTAFVRAARRYAKKHPRAAEDIRGTLQMLSDDVLDPRLRTHKLKGSLDGVSACSAGSDLRILFEFVRHESAEAILLLTMGTHDEVY